MKYSRQEEMEGKPILDYFKYMDTVGYKRLSLKGKIMWHVGNTPLHVDWWETVWIELKIKMLLLRERLLNLNEDK